MTTAIAQAFANIAFIKYWGNRDNALRLHSNGSISMNLDGFTTERFAMASDGIIYASNRQIPS